MLRHYRLDSRLLRSLLVTIITIGSLVSNASHILAASTPITTTIATDCTSPTTIATLHNGDSVSGFATLHTTDPNENGEGEPLILQSSGGFGLTIPAYELTQPFSFTAHVEGETFTGCIGGFDSDESADVSITINSTPNPGPSQQNKTNANKAAGGLGIAGGSLAVLLALCAIPPPCATSVLVGLGVLGGVTAVGAGGLAIYAADPSDPNYTVIVQPVTPSLSQQPITTAQGVTQQEADALNAYLTNMEKAIGLQRAIITSINRAVGAHDAGNAMWEDRQLQAAQQYAAQAATLFNAAPQLLANVQQAYQAEGVQSKTMTANDVFNFEQSVAANGLPSWLTQELTELGSDSNEQDLIRRLFIVQDINAVAALGGGSFPQLLTDTTLTTALQQAGQVYNEFGSNKCPLGQGYWKNHPNAWPVSSLTLGVQTYSKTELLNILKTSTTGDASLILAHQLIAAKLNIANGANATPINSTITTADSILSGFTGKLPYKVKPSSSAGQAMVNAASKLDTYNNGLLTPNCTT